MPRSCKRLTRSGNIPARATTEHDPVRRRTEATAPPDHGPVERRAAAAAPADHGQVEGGAESPAPTPPDRHAPGAAVPRTRRRDHAGRDARPRPRDPPEG